MILLFGLWTIVIETIGAILLLIITVAITDTSLGIRERYVEILLRIFEVFNILF